MEIRKIAEILDAKVLCGEDLLDRSVKSAFGCDMMSDVLAYVKDQSVLITGLCNPQVVRTAEMMDMRCIVFVRGKSPDASIIELAETKGMVILTTDLTMYESCGRLYASGLTGSNH